MQSVEMFSGKWWKCCIRKRNNCNEKVFLQGATANTSNKAEAGKAIDGDVKVISSSTHIEDGTTISGAENASVSRFVLESWN